MVSNALLPAADGEDAPAGAVLNVRLPTAERARGLGTTVYEALRQGIADGSLPPHYHLREIALAEHFGVSTTPVREALRHLEREGLVLIRPNRGAVVQAFNVREAHNLYEVRELLEAEAIRQAALEVHPDLSAAEAIMTARGPAAVASNPMDADAADAAVATGSTSGRDGGGAAPQKPARGRRGDHVDRPPTWDRDLAFHRALNSIGPNAALAALAERIHRQIQTIRAQAAIGMMLGPTIGAQLHDEHLAILAAVRRNDADEAERLVRAHIRAVRDRVLPALEHTARARS